MPSGADRSRYPVGIAPVAGASAMTGDYSREGLLTFLRDAAVAGHLNPATARSRRNAAEQLFAQLSDAEAADLRQVDVERLKARVHDLQGDQIRPEVLDLYAERLRSALADYFRFVEAPDGFVASASAERGAARRRSPQSRTQEQQALEQVRLGATNHRPDVLPIQLGRERVVYLHGVPVDLSAEEARRIARVIEALALPGDDG